MAPARKTPSSPRLTRQNWLDQGLATLEVDGFVGLKADLLARTLGVSRGSFYHHFVDLADFHESVLDRWLEVTVTEVTERLGATGAGPVEQLDTLAELVGAGSGGLERAIRAWATSDADVAAVVARVDRQRLDYLTSLFRELGASDSAARARAALMYTASVGYAFVVPMLTLAERSAALDDLAVFVRRDVS